MTKKTVQKDMIPVTAEAASVETFISQAIAAKAPVETMERLFDLRAKVKAEIAKEQFVEAMGGFQLACPVIKKTRKVMNKDGRSLRYQFAPLDGITDQIKSPLRDAGLSYSWDAKHLDGHMEVTCKITHKLGHFETSTLQIPIDKDGFMTAPQKYASALTFAKRYTLLNALGITTADEDTDAVDVGKESDAKSLKAKIVLRLRTLNKKTGTKEEVEAAVKILTHLELKEENYADIADRLQALIDENHESA